jgi:hypothetical protein
MREVRRARAHLPHTLASGTASESPAPASRAKTHDAAVASPTSQPTTKLGSRFTCATANQRPPAHTRLLRTTNHSYQPAFGGSRRFRIQPAQPEPTSGSRS